MLELPPPASAMRESARQEIPPPLRADVRLLGELLGQVLAEYGGADLLDDVEQLRRTVIEARESAAYEEQAERLVASWSIERAYLVARAFTCYFHLANLAEEHHRARVLRNRDREQRESPDSLAFTIAEIRATQGEERLAQLVGHLRVHPVFTAHPTEARRRAVVTVVRRIGAQLDRLEDPRCSTSDREDAHRRLLEEVDTLWRTAQLRSRNVRPLDEVRAMMSVFDDTLFRIVPSVYRTLDAALLGGDTGRQAPLAAAFLRFGTWIGGDRDGNASVTAAVTTESMRIQAERVLLGLEAAATRIGRALTADAQTSPAAAELGRRLEAAHAASPRRLKGIDLRSPSEPHRQYLLYVAARLKATRIHEPDLAYTSPDELLDDLRTVQRSLVSAGAPRLAYGELQHLIWQAETFGFHLAELEVRQHSAVHARALADLRSGNPPAPETEEVLAVFRAISDLQERFGVEACRRYVVSFARDADDVAAVYALAHEATHGQAGRGTTTASPVLDVIPLFETADDLRRAPAVLDAIIDLEPVRRRLNETDRRVEVMIGYSDSTKEMGPLSATLALYRAQVALMDWAGRRRVRLLIFHGRGGALGRGGGPANRAVRAQPPGSVGGQFKVTEQGEVIFSRYGNPAIARRHLEQVATAVLSASTSTAGDHGMERFAALAARADAAALGAYRGLLDSDGFADWFARVSPVDELSRMRIGSRPAYREANRGLQDLRAIPWVFAWSQMRLNLPGWYGIGSGLAAVDLGELRTAYAQWPLFSVMLENAEMSLAKTDRRIAARYLALGGRDDLAQRVLTEYDLTVDRVLAVTGHARLLEDRRVLSWAVELRNPYVDALSHLQLRALTALRAGISAATDRDQMENLLLLTVNGVAAGLQNTG